MKRQLDSKEVYDSIFQNSTMFSDRTITDVANNAKISQQIKDWLDKPENRLRLKLTDRTHWPSIINIMINCEIGSTANTEFSRFKKYADLTAIEEFVNSKVALNLNPKSEFKKIKHTVNGVSPEGIYKVLSSASSHIIAIEKDSLRQVNIIVDGIEYQSANNMSDFDSAVLLRWLGNHSKNGFRSTLLALAEYDKWFQEKHLRPCFFTLIKDLSQLDNMKVAMLSTQYAHYHLTDLETFRKRLAGLPFIEADDFLNYTSEKTTKKYELVAVKDIIAAIPSGNGWDFIHRGGEKYVYLMAQAIIAGKFIPSRPPTLRSYTNIPSISLYKKNSLYCVTDNGRHRVAALKGIDPDLQVWAEVETAY